MSDHDPHQSDDFSTEASAENGGWPQWQLTAFVLGELDEQTTAELKKAARRDPELTAEIKEIRRTLSQVKSVFAAEPVPAEASSSERQKRLDRIFGEAASSSSAAAPVEPVSATGPRSAALAWAPALASVASVLLLVGLSYPAISGWLNQGDGSVAAAPEELNTSNAAAGLDSAADAGAMSAEEASDEVGASGQTQALKTNPFLSASANEGTKKASSQGSSAPLEPSKDAQGPGDAPRNLDVSISELAQPLANKVEHMESERPGGLSDPFDGVDPFGGADPFGGPGATEPFSYSPDRADSLAAKTEQGGSSAGGMGGYGGEGFGGEALANKEKPSVELDAERQVLGQPHPFGELSEARRELDDLKKEIEESIKPDSWIQNGGTGSIEPYPSNLSLVTSAADKASVAAGGGGRARGDSSSERVPLRDEMEERYRNRPRTPAYGDRYEEIYENEFERVKSAPLSTFSIDVDTASYAKSRQLLLETRRLPPANAVRIEEFVNYFDYEYSGPKKGNEAPFGTHLAIADCPWNAQNKLVRIALQAEKLDLNKRPKANIVFLLDVSGSMDEPNKLPLVKETLRMLVEQLGENDRVAMVVYAGAAGCVLEGTRGDKQKKILRALDELEAGGSTNGADGIQLAYQLARDGFVEGGVNRVVLCTDGDFNVGVTSTDALVNIVEENAKSNIFLTVLGYGMGNTNDEMMERISNRGNGVYGFVDNKREAYRQMVKQLSGNLMTVAKDVKIQVEFNPEKVSSYRLLGYENRKMAAKDFRNDKKDAGEIGAGHRVTALYEIVPAGAEKLEPPKRKLRYGKKTEANVLEPADKGEEAGPSEEADIEDSLSNEWLAVMLRYKQPDEDEATELVYPLKDEASRFSDADRDFRWAASMVEFGMLLRDSRYRGSSNWSGLIEQASSAAGIAPDADRQECLEMIRTSAALSGRK